MDSLHTFKPFPMYPFGAASRAIRATLRQIERVCEKSPLDEKTHELCQSLELAKTIANRVSKYQHAILGRTLYDDKEYHIDKMIFTLRSFEKLLPELYENDASVRQAIDKAVVPFLRLPGRPVPTAEDFFFRIRQSTREAENISCAMTFRHQPAANTPSF